MPRRVPVLVFLSAAVLAPAPRAAAQFTAGNVVVLRIGDGATTLSASASPGALVEINAATGLPTGVTVALPTAAAANAGGITFGGTATLATHLHRSTDRAFLTVAGYDAPVGTASVGTSPSTTANRTIAQITGPGAVTTQRMTDTTFSAGEARSVVSDGTQYWLGGSAPASADRGVRYVSGASATGSTRLVTATVGDVNVFNNRLFYSTSTAVNAVAGSPPPTGGTPATTPLVNGTNVNGFVLFDRDPGSGDPALGGLDTLYIADVGNIIKLEFAGTSWAPRGTFDSGQLGNTLFGLTGALNGGTVELYATDTSVNGKLAKITDASAFGDNINASDTWSLAAGANLTFRGVDFAPAPVPEPEAVLAAAAGGLGLAGLAHRRRSNPVA
jgi:hypothetical protein